MEKQFILHLFTAGIALLVFAFVWAGILLGRKHVRWDDKYDASAYCFFVLLVSLITVFYGLKAYFWFTEHIIYLP